MKELLLLAATTIKEDKLLEKLADAINERKLIKTEKTEAELNTALHLAIFHYMIKGDHKKMFEIIQEMESQEKKLSIFETSGN